ncbi:MAG: sulfatase [Deltaproteobacteria bacterium]|nr:sulfatase [Deltaproteobacteria bacterium]
MGHADISESATSKRPSRLGVLAFLALLVNACCGPAHHPVRNVILISIDTLRADHLGTYGHDRPTSPNLDAFASDGVVFEDASATSPWTLPSHASLLTGRYPRGHGVRTEEHRLGDEVPVLAAVMSERGFKTAAIVNTLFLSPRFGIARGFDSFEVIESDQSRQGAAHRITNKAIERLEGRREERNFLFVHYFDVHSDYLSLPRYERLFAPEPGRFTGRTIQLLLAIRGDVPIGAADADRLTRLYDGGIRQLDDEIGRFFEWLREHGWLEDTLVIVTSDHGEEFLEHGGLLHGNSHYQEMLHIPLILGGAGIPAGRRIGAAVSLVDIAPTIFSVLEIPSPPGMDGADLRPLWQEPQPVASERLVFAEAGPGELRSVRSGRSKLITQGPTGPAELYDLANDPAETQDLAAERPELVAALEAEIARFAASAREPQLAPELSDDEKERLQALGYLRWQEPGN